MTEVSLDHAAATFFGWRLSEGDITRFSRGAQGQRIFRDERGRLNLFQASRCPSAIHLTARLDRYRGALVVAAENLSRETRGEKEVRIIRIDRECPEMLTAKLATIDGEITALDDKGITGSSTFDI